MNRTMSRVRNARLEVAWYRRGSARGRPLLLLHELYGSADDWPRDLEWPGPVHALDFAGHGGSDPVRGGGYTPEHFVGDADAVLRKIESERAHEARTGSEGVAVAGAGLGAYVALLLAGARPSVISAALLGPGAGLGETDGEPDFEKPPPRLTDEGDVPDGCDPELWRFVGEIKPHDYVESFARRARRLLLIEDGGFRPAWWSTAREAGRSQATGPGWSGALDALETV